MRGIVDLVEAGAEVYPLLDVVARFIGGCTFGANKVTIRKGILSADVLLSAASGGIELNVRPSFDLFGAARIAIEKLIISRAKSYPVLRQAGVAIAKAKDGNLLVAIAGLSVSSASVVGGMLVVMGELV